MPKWRDWFEGLGNRATEWLDRLDELDQTQGPFGSGPLRPDRVTPEKPWSVVDLPKEQLKAAAAPLRERLADVELTPETAVKVLDALTEEVTALGDAAGWPINTCFESSAIVAGVATAAGIPTQTVPVNVKAFTPAVAPVFKVRDGETAFIRATPLGHRLRETTTVGSVLSGGDGSDAVHSIAVSTLPIGDDGDNVHILADPTAGQTSMPMSGLLAPRRVVRRLPRSIHNLGEPGRWGAGEPWVTFQPDPQSPIVGYQILRNPTPVNPGLPGVEAMALDAVARLGARMAEPDFFAPSSPAAPSTPETREEGPATDTAPAHTAPTAPSEASINEAHGLLKAWEGVRDRVDAIYGTTVPRAPVDGHLLKSLENEPAVIAVMRSWNAVPLAAMNTPPGEVALGAGATAEDFAEFPAALDRVNAQLIANFPYVAETFAFAPTNPLHELPNTTTALQTYLDSDARPSHHAEFEQRLGAARAKEADDVEWAKNQGSFLMPPTAALLGTEHLYAEEVARHEAALEARDAKTGAGVQRTAGDSGPGTSNEQAPGTDGPKPPPQSPGGSPGTNGPGPGTDGPGDDKGPEGPDKPGGTPGGGVPPLPRNGPPPTGAGGAKPPPPAPLPSGRRRLQSRTRRSTGGSPPPGEAPPPTSTVPPGRARQQVRRPVVSGSTSFSSPRRLTARAPSPNSQQNALPSGHSTVDATSPGAGAISAPPSSHTRRLAGLLAPKSSTDNAHAPGPRTGRPATSGRAAQSTGRAAAPPRGRSESSSGRPATGGGGRPALGRSPQSGPSSAPGASGQG